MVLIGLVGRKGVGKDTFADYLVKNHQFEKHAFAEPLKQICKSQIKIFEYIITILKRCVKDYFSFNPHKPNFIAKAQRCKLCDTHKCITVKNEKLCLPDLF